MCGADVDVAAAHAGVPVRPTSTYGMTKRDQEEVLQLLLPPLGVRVRDKKKVKEEKSRRERTQGRAQCIGEG